MKYKLLYEVVVRDPKGKVTFREKGKSRSFLKQWNELLYAHMTSLSLNIRSTTNVNNSASENAISWKAIPTSSYGLQLGTDDTAVDISDYKLGAEIVNGYTAGTMFREAADTVLPVVAGNKCSWKANRTFVNWSGGDITVREMGLVCAYYSGGTKYMQATRDVFITPLLVVYGGGVVGEYTLEVEA